MVARGAPEGASDCNMFSSLFISVSIFIYLMNERINEKWLPRSIDHAHFVISHCDMNDKQIGGNWWSVHVHVKLWVIRLCFITIHVHGCTYAACIVFRTERHTFRYLLTFHYFCWSAWSVSPRGAHRIFCRGVQPMAPFPFPPLPSCSLLFPPFSSPFPPS